jgi:hypothetical protein
MTEWTLSEPYPASWTVRRALGVYLAENGFTEEEYSAKTTAVSFLGIRFGVPNTKSHQRAIKLHDLHHVATGYGTDLVGEGEISAWEARGGLLPLGLYVAAIVISVGLVGIVRAPRRARTAWKSTQRGSALWCMDDAYEALLDLTVGELRDKLGVPRAGLATSPRTLHAYAPKPELRVSSPSS